MPSETGITSILGVEKQVNKNQNNGYAGLDVSGFVSANVIGYMSLIPIAVYAQQRSGYVPLEFPPTTSKSMPYIDDAATFSNLIFVADGHYISYDDHLECFNMRKI